MKLSIKKPAFSLNKAYRKVKPHRDDFEAFKANLNKLLSHASEDKFEDFNKTIAADFLKDTYYSPKFAINIKQRNDLVIHTSESPDSEVGVIVEAKAPANKAEMITRDNANVKALHELVLYFLRERITNKNKDLKHLIATNCYEWFLFDAHQFEKAFAQNKRLVKQYGDFVAGRLSGTNTDFFYKEIAKPFIEKFEQPLECTWFDLRSYEKNLASVDEKSERKLIALYKIFSPEHILKLNFANDSNTLDQNFYKELLHIIGLEETKVKGKKLIGRKEEGSRNPGSLLENTIDHIISKDKLSRVTNLKSFGETREERLFDIALELCITWMNRILFLKLLEAQLISYQKGDKSVGFLNTKRIKDFDVLDDLFFDVLAKKYKDRNQRILNEFGDVPYLNSSLFDPTELEHDALFISNLRDDMTLPLLSQTVLKGDGGKRRKGEMNTIAYLFEFLDAYDFTSEGSEDIQEESKTLINASVLGLIFEKINGYKDGSFFTPGFITMYMCRETIRRAVVQKFNEAKGWTCESLADVYDKIEDRSEANDIINSLKICDPAVGSGHFLVSALNEILAIKHDLRVLQDRDGRRLKEYELVVENDELIVTDEEGALFEYHPESKESQRVQEALFHEKQTIIENCLFGVDINSNSVKICRLRLWIELLKHAYYKSGSSEEVIPQRMPGSGANTDLKTPDQVRGDDVNKNEEGRHLETLPNIDINIKTGNSLISRFALNADLKEALKKSKWSIDSYRAAVQSYRNARNKDEKREMMRLIGDIKGDFRTEILRTDKNVVKLKKLSDELVVHTTQTSMFDQTAKEKKEWKKTTEKLTKAIAKLETEIEEIKNNKIFENAFEWRFEFPEVLNEQGDFVGFDVVIGNPPYYQIQKMELDMSILKESYSTYEKMGDIYALFYERGNQIISNSGRLSYITSNKWMRANYGASLRDYLVSTTSCYELIDFNYFQVFDEASVDTNILSFEKGSSDSIESAILIKDGFKLEFLQDYKTNHSLSLEGLSSSYWNIVSKEVKALNEKLSSDGNKLKDWDLEINYGVKTGLNAAFIIDKETRDKLIQEDPKNEEIIVPYLRGRDIRRYGFEHQELWLVFTRRDIDIDKYPVIKKYLSGFKERLEPKPKGFKGKWKGRKSGSYTWYEIQDTVAYHDSFKKEKIVYAETMRIHKSNRSNFPRFGYDSEEYFCDKTTFIATGEHLKYLLGFMNSKIGEYLIREYVTKLDTGGYMMQKVFIEEIPVMSPKKDEQITSKVTEIISLKKENPQADTSKLEAEIDQMMYELYGLSEEEIAIVEGSLG